MESRDLADINPQIPPYQLSPKPTPYWAEPLLRQSADVGLQVDNQYTSSGGRGLILYPVSNPSEARILVVEGKLQRGIAETRLARGTHHRFIPGFTVVVDREEIPTEFLDEVIRHEGLHGRGLIHSFDSESIMFGFPETFEDLASSTLTYRDAIDLWFLYLKKRK